MPVFRAKTVRTPSRSILVKLGWILCRVLLLLLSREVGVFAGPQRNATPSPHGPLSVPCENCHTAADWTPIRANPAFNHDQTRFALRGMHEKVSCTRCHASPIFANVGKNCADCHADIHLRKFGANCAECHSVQAWFTTRQQVRNHSNLFPLIGAHATVECEGCHKSFVGGQYRVLPYCSACHMLEFKKATNPNHLVQHFSLTCDSCHSQDSWLGAISPLSRVPLPGAKTRGGR